MENEMVQVEEAVKIEVEEIKIETAEIGRDSFEVGETTWYLPIKENNECTNQVVSDGMKNELNNFEPWIKCDVKSAGAVEMQFETIKLEKNLDIEKLDVTEMIEEVILKKENHCDKFMGANPDIVLNRINNEFAEVGNAVIAKIEDFVKTEEIDLGMFTDTKDCQNIDTAHFNHAHSTENGKPEILMKSAAKQKILRKHHETACKKASSRSFTCYNCNYTACHKIHLINHMKKHRSQKGFSYKHNMCMHCDATFKCKQSLDDHVIKKHPDFITSICRTIHKCTHCTFKTVYKHTLYRHMLKHPETSSSYMLSRCIHCNATFKSKRSLDFHIIRKHPDFIASISSKIHECRHCTFKTTIKGDLTRHMLEHPETSGSYRLSTCIHCNATFKDKSSLDNHTVRKHPDFITSVSRKIHECTQCTYKTTHKNHLASHILNHSESFDYKLSTCIECNAAFRRKQSLDDHIIKKHPNSIASISSKIHECTHCTFKTTIKGDLTRHMLEHPETSGSYRLSTCIHCNATFKDKSSLDNHTVRKHPDFITSVSRKIHECTQCTYKTTHKNHLASHILNHSESFDYKLSTCIECNAAFRRKQSLDDHIIKKHPNSIASISSKIHECTHCTFKTVNKSDITRHMLKHSKTTGSYKLNTCIHCKAAFTKKQSLDDHIIKKHPSFIASTRISNEVHECTHCTFKTVHKHTLHKHMLKHPGTFR